MRVRNMKMSMEERIKILEDKVLKLEGLSGNPLKVESGNPYKSELIKEKIVKI